ncbi:phospholipase D family nuclease [Candidatus Rickettsiella viridis]|nr:phospholipase D family protein [Candidatus Rickettsiella viridis]
MTIDDLLMLKPLLICFLLLAPFYTTISQASTASCPRIQVCFTPGQNCTMQITDVLDNAKKSIAVQAYSFTSVPIAKHLVEARKRGVVVKVILDKSQKSQKYSASRFLLNQHIPVWIDYKPAIAHNKIMIIDEKEVITGSFNFTKAAQNKNAENVLIIRDLTLAKRYMENWQRRQAASEVFG